MSERLVKLSYLLFLFCLFFAVISAQPKRKIKTPPPAAQNSKAQIIFDEGEKLFDLATAESLQKAITKFTESAKLFALAKNVDKQALALMFAGRSFSSLGNEAEAKKFFENSLTLFQVSQNSEMQAYVYSNLGYSYFQTNQNEKALEFYKQGVKTADKVSDLSKKKIVKSLLYFNAGRTYEIIGNTVQAIESYQKSIENSDKTLNADILALALSRLAEMQSNFGDSRTAIDVSEQALALARELADAKLEAQILSNIGLIYYNSGNKSKSLDYFQNALKIFADNPDTEVKLLLLQNIAMAHSGLGEIQKAVEFLNQALQLSKNLSNLNWQSIILNNLGLNYWYLNDLKKAAAYYEESIKIAGQIQNKNQESITLLNLAEIESAQEKYNEAIQNYLKVLKATEETFNVQLAINALNNVATIFLKLGEPKQALIFLEKALPPAQNGQFRTIETDILNNFGGAYLQLGDSKKAADYFTKSVLIAQQFDSKRQVALGLANLMFVWKKAGNLGAAAFFGKSAINVYQQLRGNIASLDKSLQKNYLASIEDKYRDLADVLIAQGRISEAEQVLAMLKQDEYFDYLRRDDRVAKELVETVALSDEEKLALANYNTIASTITSIGREFAELDSERKKYEAGQFPKQARFDQLKTQLAAATLTFQKFLDELKLKFGQKDERVVQIDSSLQNTLKRVKANRTAVVSTIVGENRLNLIVTTANTQRAHTVEISEKDLNKFVLEFRQGLTNPVFDPRPAAQKLYDALVRPIEDDLKGIEADTILWSLDGTLRYIPTAALWDKEKGYLAERFSSVVLTLASRETLALPVGNKQEWSALGVGVSKATEGFSALSAVPDELDCIITDEQTNLVSAKPKCEKGIIKGKKLLDDKFTITAFEDSLGRFPIIHIASHFALRPGNDKDSFLLLGGGEKKRFTVGDLRNASLSDVELMVLSACNTATPAGAATNGIEIEGFGATAQKQGAKSIMASLWAVADDPTREFMVNFYSLYSRQNLTKSEAVRQTQIAMINGTIKQTAANLNRADPLPTAGGKPALPPFIADKNKPLAHPYFWSPFVLIGNWR